jgi:hypothetical protein
MANLLAQAIPGGITNGILNNWDALKADFDAVAYLPFGDEYWDAMNQIMNGIGNREIATQQIVNWFEMNRMEVPFTVATETGGATAGSTITITIPSSEVDAVTGYSFPIANEIWRHAKTGELYQVITKPAANQLTLRPLTATVVPATDIAAGDSFFYVGVSVAENSGAQDPKFVFDTKYSAKLQTFRNDALASSEALYNQLWYSQLENGTATPYSNSRDIIYLQREHQVAIVNTFLAGKTNTNTGMNGYQFTNGLIPTILTSGQVVDCDTATLGPDVADIYALEAKLAKIDGSVKNYMVWTSGQSSSIPHKPGAFMNMWQTGGRAAANKTDKWQLGVHIVSEIAFKFINAQKYGLLTNIN